MKTLSTTLLSLALSGFAFWIAAYKVPEQGLGGGTILFLYTVILFPLAVLFFEKGKWFVVLTPVSTMLLVITWHHVMDRGWNNVGGTLLFGILVLGLIIGETLFFSHIRNVAIEHSRRSTH